MPALLGGDYILENHLAYGLRAPLGDRIVLRWGTPRRSEIVIFVAPAFEKYCIKRVIGLPGDIVEARNDQLFVNEEAIGPSAKPFAAFRVPDDHFFLVGDNRDASTDSRHFGCVAQDRILGRANRIILSLDPDRHYCPRWQRYGQAL